MQRLREPAPTDRRKWLTLVYLL